MFEPRIYREKMNTGRFSPLVVREKESDLWIGISPEDRAIAEREIIAKLREIRSVLETYIRKHPVFFSSLHPLGIYEDDPPLIKAMKRASRAAGTGPMASVAGLVAEEMGKFILETCQPRELIVENGGDIFLSVKDEIKLSVYAGNNLAFTRLGLLIPKNSGFLGICTSSGMFGHSFSLGKADSVTVVSRSCSYADAWATAIANSIKQASDVDEAMELFRPEMKSLLCIKDDRLGIKGNMQIVPLN